MCDIFVCVAIINYKYEYIFLETTCYVLLLL